jgi:hypothetical protein
LKGVSAAASADDSEEQPAATLPTTAQGRELAGYIRDLQTGEKEKLRLVGEGDAFVHSFCLLSSSLFSIVSLSCHENHSGWPLLFPPQTVSHQLERKRYWFDTAEEEQDPGWPRAYAMRMQTEMSEVMEAINEALENIRGVMADADEEE